MNAPGTTPSPDPRDSLWAEVLALNVYLIAQAQKESIVRNPLYRTSRPVETTENKP